MTDYKLLALDMDGTLLDDNQQISDLNLYWMRQALEAGVTVIFSTGRGYISAIDYAREINLNTPMITVNGGEIWENPNHLLERTELNKEWIKRLHKLALQYPDVWYWAYTTQKIYNKQNWEELNDQIDQYTWLKFGYYTEDLEQLEKIKSIIQDWNALEMSNSSIYNIELNPLGVSKASAIKKLCVYMGIQMDQVIAMGDSLNDIKALEAVGLGVAVGNAQEEVKAAANYVSVTNNEHAVAQIIQQFIFNK